ncbi:MAG TPA: PAS domain-containing protein, partial [Usitatibacter sp.]|nr:PAS domain-containing protein [Usitatibacter sp.]
EWFRAHYFPRRDAAGAVWGVMVVLVDIQQLKATEAALGERERHLSLIMDAVGFAVTYVDRDRIVRFVNRPAAEWMHRPVADLVGRSIDELVPPDVRAAVSPHMARAFAGEPSTYERETLWPGHDSRRVRGHMVPDRDAAGEVRGILIVIVDIEDDWRLRQALDDQRKRLQLVVDNIGVPLTYFDRDLKLAFANQTGIDWRIPRLEDALGRHVSEIYDAETMAVITPEIAAAMRGEKRVYERQARLESGERRWVRVHVVPDVGADGAVRGLYTLLLDVDQDHRMREALERQEAQLRHFAENIPGPIAMVDANFRFLFANKVYQRLRGKALGEIVGRAVPEILGPEATAVGLAPFVEALKRGEPCSYERLEGPPGEEPRWHLVRLAPIMDGEGRFNGYYVVASDIHDMKLAGERQRRQQEQLRLFMDNIPDAVVYLDRDRRILFANRQFAQLRGFTSENIIGRTTADVMGAEIAGWIAERTQKVLDRGEVATY